MIKSSLTIIAALFYKFVPLLLILFPLPIVAAITIVSPTDPEAMLIAGEIEDHLSCETKITDSPSENSSNIMVSIGFNALTRSITSGRKIIASFISHADYERLKSSDYEIVPAYTEPSQDEIIHFLNQQFPNSRVGFIYSDYEQLYVESIKQKAKDKSIYIVTTPFNGSVQRSVRRIAKKNIDILFVGKNRNLYNSSNIYYVLELSSRKHIPVVTTSNTYIKIGALASLYVNKDRIIDDTLNHLKKELPLCVKSHDKQPGSGLSFDINRVTADRYNFYLNFKEEGG